MKKKIFQHVIKDRDESTWIGTSASRGWVNASSSDNYLKVDMLTRRMLENTVARSVNRGLDFRIYKKIIFLEAFSAEELVYMLSNRFKEGEEADEIQSAFKLFVSTFDLASFFYRDFRTPKQRVLSQ